MSGSSLDGLDMAHCQFDQVAGKMEWSILDAQTIPFTDSWKSKLQMANTLQGFDLIQLDAQFGIFIGEEVKAWIEEKNINTDLIASHGHTVFHEPALHFTTQIGNGAQIAAITRIDTITDFRQADVANRGHGAPFAPVADRDLFSAYDGYLNLGGIANISIQLPDQTWKAWDIGPCNQALNFLAGKKNLPFDANGTLASSGRIIPEVVKQLKKYFPPTSGNAFSLSNANVHKTWLDELEKSQVNVQDLLACTTEAIVQLIIDHLVALQEHQQKYWLPVEGLTIPSYSSN
jgi:anhydro-N-acetylmuramic acid kinase